MITSWPLVQFDFGLNVVAPVPFTMPSLYAQVIAFTLLLLRPSRSSNVPSTVTDPLFNLHKIACELGRVGVVFDTRFATCHENAKETLSDGAVAPHIEHVHISDYRGGKKEFTCLRPVFHPLEGKCDFPLIFGMLRDLDFEGSFNLESPGITGEGPEIDLDNLKRSLTFIKESYGTAAGLSDK